MQKSSSSNIKKKRLNLLSLGPYSANLLILFIIITSFISDKYISNSNITIPLILSIIVSFLLTYWGIPKLNKLRLKQIIRIEGPQNHLNKSGTPTMGGLIIIPAGLIIGNLVNIKNYNHQLLAINLLTISFMLVGCLDDWQGLNQKTNKGLTVQNKLILQILISIIFLYWAQAENWINSKIMLFGTHSIDVGLLIWPIAIFVLLAESNATNLTDGLDGLASGCGALVFTGLAIQLMLRGNNNDPMMAGFCIAMAGAWLGFLFHNSHPAKVFMGDTGSLPMGAALGGIALISNNLWPLLIMGGIFLAESLSVIIQVFTFKITKLFTGKGKRILRMAPIHHHFELTGHNENSIVNSFWIGTICLIVVGVLVRPTN